MNFLEICGLILLCYAGVRLLSLVITWLSNFFKHDVLKAEDDDYAVVTGATDGIGLEYAKQLAAKGFNLFLLSRTSDKLIRVSEQIKSNYPQCQNVQILTVNFSDQDIYEEIETKIESLNGNVMVLVNNVGMVHPVPAYFTDYPTDYNKKLINTNITSVTMMSEIVLKLMIKKKRGIIINISSFSGTSEIPLFSSYSASKAYMNSLGSVLAKEYEQHGIIVQTVTPNQVETKASKNVHDSNVSVSAKDYVRYALKTVGKETHTNGHPKHKILNNAASLIEALVGQTLFMSFKFFVSKSLLEKTKRI